MMPRGGVPQKLTGKNTCLSRKPPRPLATPPEKGGEFAAQQIGAF